MVANVWQLRADVTALDAAAQTWAEMCTAMTAAADQLVVTAQKAFTGGWDSMSAEGYDAHRRQVVGSLDGLAAVAENISDTLVKVSGSLTAAQRRLDREWSFVALIPHSLVGPDQMVVFNPGSDEQSTQIKMAEANAATIRSDLDHTLYGDVDTLRRAKTEFEYTSRQWAEVVARGPEAINVLGWTATANYVPSETTTVTGETQSGAVAAGAAGAVGGVTAGSLAPISVSFSAPTLGGAALAGGAGLFAAGRSARRGAPQSTVGTGAMGGAPMAGAAAGRGGGAMLAGKGGAGGSRSGLRGASVKAPSEPDSAEVREAKEAKQQALADRKAAREARKAAREARKVEREGGGEAEKPTANIVDDG